MRGKAFDTSTRVDARGIPRYDAAADRLCPLSRSDTFQRRLAAVATAEAADREAVRAEAEKRRKRITGAAGLESGGGCCR
jgi:hypothetical protein